MIEWREVSSDRHGLRIYRIDAESSGIPGAGKGPGRVPNPFDLILPRFDTPTARYLRESFTLAGAGVGASSFSVACHVVSLPDLLLVVDSTYRTTAREIFPEVLDCITRDERRRLAALNNAVKERMP